MKTPVARMGKSYGKSAPSGVPALSRGKGSSNETGVKRGKGTQSAGEMWKAPKAGAKEGIKSAASGSSGNVAMRAESSTSKNMYNAEARAPQPSEYSNKGKSKTTFVC